MKLNKKHKGESFESLMKRFRKSVEKSDILNEVKAREHYIKPSTTKKLSRAIAKKREKKRQDEQDIKRSRR
jgi:small subunit ribosomal protein S21